MAWIAPAPSVLSERRVPPASAEIVPGTAASPPAVDRAPSARRSADLT
jgi:hypothetical protein